MNSSSTLKNAVIGAVVTVALSFTVVSPLLGGVVAGYLQREPPRRGARVGALSGAIATVPFFVVIVLGIVLLFGSATARFGVPGAVELLVIVFLILPLTLVWNVGLSALGGYLGAYLRSETKPQGGEAASSDIGY